MSSLRIRPKAAPTSAIPSRKNAVTRGLAGCTDDDIVIFSDLDEIPNPDKIREILQNFQEDKNLSLCAAFILLLSEYGGGIGQSAVVRG